MHLFDVLSRRFGETIELTVGLDAFRFRCRSAESSIAPALNKNEAGKVRAVGEQSRALARVGLVDFFHSRPFGAETWPLEDDFVLFLRYGLMLARLDAGAGSFFKPNVRVPGSSQLAPFFRNREVAVLRRTLLKAGAASVRFPDRQEAAAPLSAA